MSTDPTDYSYLPEGVRRQIATGQVPPPRTASEGEDRVRDLSLARAVAQDAGNWGEWDRLSAEALALTRKGVESSWSPPERAAVDASRSQGDLRHAAEQAAADGDPDRAHALWMAASQAQVRPQPELLAQAAEAAAAGDWDLSDRLNAQALLAMGNVPAPEAPEPPAQPATRSELLAAAQDADDVGDWQEGDRHRASLLELSRRSTEGRAH